jgi:hypothetical protein
LVFRDSAKNLANLSNQFAINPHRRFQFNERSELFIRTHNETLSIVAMRVNHPDRLPALILPPQHNPNSIRLY